MGEALPNPKCSRTISLKRKTRPLLSQHFSVTFLLNGVQWQTCVILASPISTPLPSGEGSNFPSGNHLSPSPAPPDPMPTLVQKSTVTPANQPIPFLWSPVWFWSFQSPYRNGLPRSRAVLGESRGERGRQSRRQSRSGDADGSTCDPECVCTCSQN